MGNKLKHLEFIQNVINRMANTSFLLKGLEHHHHRGLVCLQCERGLNRSSLPGGAVDAGVLVLGLVFPLAGAALQIPV